MAEIFPFDLAIEKLENVKDAESLTEAKIIVDEIIEMLRIGKQTEIIKLSVEQVYEGQMIQMIKAIRQATRLGLYESKMAAEKGHVFYWSGSIKEIREVLVICSPYGKIKIDGSENFKVLFGQK